MIPIERNTKEAIRHCRTSFLDSGAHSLYTIHCMSQKHRNGYAWYTGPEFTKYLDSYAALVKKYKKGLDFYANVDVIFNPELSWKALRYLEEYHGLNPIPVIHYGTDLKWFDRHLRAGYKFIGVGGLGQEATRDDYKMWADRVFDFLCPGSEKLPIVRTHGFAMSSYTLMLRYPWWSVDSASWAKCAGFGSIFVPHKRNGKFTFERQPYVIGFSHSNKITKVKGKHYLTLSRLERRVVRDWLREIDIPLGKAKGQKVIEEGVLTHYGTRAVANIRFFERIEQWLPPYPRAFKITPRKGFGLT